MKKFLLTVTLLIAFLSSAFGQATVVKGRFEGHDIGGNFRFTNVFIRRSDSWQCAAMHLTRIAQQ